MGDATLSMTASAKTTWAESSTLWGARIAVGWLTVAVAIVLLAVLGTRMTVAATAWWYLAWTIAASGLCWSISAAGMALDLGGWRLGLGVFYGVALAGGWPGAFLARRFIRNAARQQWQLGFLWGSCGLHILVALFVFGVA